MPETHRILPVLPAQAIERFWSHVDICSPDQCWPWTSCVNPYGRFWFKGIEYKASRVAYWLEYGIDLGPNSACHSCDNPPCCNPAHIFKGSHAENIADMYAKGRKRIGEQHHRAKLTATQVREIRERHSSGGVQILTLSREYGVSRASIGSIVHRRNWKQLT